MTSKSSDVREVSAKSGSTSAIEIIDAPELARRLQVPASWVRQRATGSRFLREQRIPHIRFGRYIRFRWGSAELKAWLEACAEQ
jgi:hypothetical protein